VARYNAAVLSALAPNVTTILVRLTRWWPLMVFRVLFQSFSPPPARRGSTRGRAQTILFISEILPWGTVAWLSRKLGGPRYAVMVHGLDLQNAMRVPRKRWFARRVLRGAHRIIANSAYTASLACELGVTPNHITIIPPAIGITPALAQPAQTPDVRRANSLEHARIILSVGRLIARKGFDTLIQAMTIVQRTHPRAVLAIIGDGPERPRLESLARHEQIAVRFPGALDDMTIAAWYAACDVFALLPRELPPQSFLPLPGGGEGGGGDVEGFGIVYLEAGAFGKPVVGTRSGGVPEAVLDNETGLLVPPDDPVAAAAAITRLLSDRTIAERLGAAGRTRSQEFTRESFARHFRAALNGQKLFPE
jgi:phosphatidylinositol alpha-1,6-mannosyltransferase